jgi:hypothetical protein
MPSDRFEFATNGLGVAVGLLLAGYAAQSYLWHGYMKANPSVGSVSTTPGFGLFYAAMFVAGTVVAYTSFVSGLQSALATAGE